MFKKLIDLIKKEEAEDKAMALLLASREARSR